MAHLLGLSIGFGLVTASVLALASVGLTLQFGVTNYINFAYGEFLTLGAYFAWIANVMLHWDIWIAMLFGALVIGVFAVGINRTVLMPFVRKRSSLFIMLIVTFGLSLLLQNAMLAVFGSDFQQFTVGASPSHQIGFMILTTDQIIIIGITLLAMVGIYGLLTYTKMGKAMRAMSDNSDLARVCGIDTGRMTDLTWFVSGILAGLAGLVLTLNITSFEPTTGAQFLFVIFAAVILGGIGKPYGAMLGALVIGLATEVSAVFVEPSYKNAVAFVILVVVLLLRPQGLLRSAGKN